MAGPIKLDFSEKYDDNHAQKYLHKHQANLGRRLSHWRDVQLARKALTLAFARVAAERLVRAADPALTQTL